MFKKTILDNQKLIESIEVIERDYIFFQDLLTLNKIVSFVGPRRVGKTFLMFQFVKELIKNKKIKSEQIIFIDFSLHIGQNLDYKKLIENYKEIYPDETPFFVFDEIQDIGNFKEFVLGIYNSGYKVFLSGSNSKLLSSELSTSFRGRVFEYKVLPLTFQEVLRFKKVPIQNYYSTQDFVKIKNIFTDTIQFGTFPEIVLSQNKMFKLENLKTYLDILIYKDLLERYKILNEVSLKYLLKRLTNGYTKLLNITKIYNELKSQNIKIGKTTLFEYYEYTKNIFYCYELENFYNPKASKKTFLYNIGFNKLLSNNTNIGQSLENIVFLELLKKYDKVFFKKNGLEIDFFVPKTNTNFQVCYEINNENYQRETKVFKKTPKNERNILIYVENNTDFEISGNFEMINFFDFIKL